MTANDQLLGMLAVWPCCLALVLWSNRKNGTGTGLVVSYALQLWLLHWLGTAMYALPWFNGVTLVGVLGLEQSTIAIVAFTVGSAIVAPGLVKPRRNPADPAADDPAGERWLLVACLAAGTLAFFVLQPILRPIPTIGALASAASNLLLVGLGMACWNGYQNRRRSGMQFWSWLGLSASLPFVTIAMQGFLGYGFAAMLTVFAFVASFYRPRWKIVAASAAIGYMALSIYVTYMRDRSDIRSVVWSDQAYSSRISTVTNTFRHFEFFDQRNPDHLSYIDDRLNQNVLVGMAVEYLSDYPQGFANGRTLWEAMVSPIPRLIWPTKPTAAGSGELVSEFTGRQLNTVGTSIGIGHVMEWYVNFGTYGVFFGMLLTGVAIGWLDRMGAARLQQGNWARFIMWWLPGLSLLQVGGSLVEAVSGACAALGVALGINWVRSAMRTRRARFVHGYDSTKRLHSW